MSLLQLLTERSDDHTAVIVEAGVADGFREAGRDGVAV